MSIIKSRKDKFDALWIEKYRPESLSEMILNENYKIKFTEMINEENIPHLLLVGKPGTGKTTLTYILINSLIKHEMDFLEFNGSLDKGIDIVRNNIVEFCKSPPMFSKFKIVFFDEADKLTIDAQLALRGIIEKYASDVRFIFTANYLYKIDDAIQSRLQTYTFQSLPKEETKKIISTMLNKEHVSYNDNDLMRLIDLVYPDVRKLINELNKFIILNNNIRMLSLTNNSGATVLKELDIVEKIINIWMNCKNINIIKENIKQIVNILNTNQIDYALIYRALFSKSNIFPIKALVSKFANTSIKVPFEEMHMIQLVWETVTMLQKNM